MNDLRPILPQPTDTWVARAAWAVAKWLPILPLGYLRALEEEVIALRSINGDLKHQVATAHFKMVCANDRARAFQVHARDAVEAFLPRLSCYPEEVTWRAEDRPDLHETHVTVTTYWPPLHYSCCRRDRDMLDSLQNGRAPAVPLSHIEYRMNVRLIAEAADQVARAATRRLAENLEKLALARLHAYLDRKRERDGR